MKRITLLLFAICSLNAIGQEKLKIEIDNLGPRVGQKVTFSINVEFLTDYFKEEIGEDIDFTRSTAKFGRLSDDFERVIIFDKAKKYKIGPINFEFNGKKYTTETIEVNVLPKLPMEEGLWLRTAEINGQQYLILEQLIRNVSNKTVIENGGYSHTIGGVMREGKEFAEFNEELTKGVNLSFNSSSSNTLQPEDSELFDVGFTYSIQKYKISFDDDFDEKYIITETDLKNLPENYDIGKIKLKK